MSAIGNYASTPYIGSGTTITADTSYTQPTAGTVGVIVVGENTGARFDQLDCVTQGTSVAGLLRLWLCEGTPLPAITSITFAATTATVTFASAHGMTTGNFIAVVDTFPADYQVKNAAVTVTGATTLTYVMATTPTINATTLGTAAMTPTVPVYHLLREEPITASVGSATIPAFQARFNSMQNADWMPIVLPPAWSLRSTVTVTQTNALKITARGGSF